PVKPATPIISSAYPMVSATLERNIVMLFPRVLELLVAQLAQAHRHPPPRRMRHDYLVDEAHARGHERVGEALFIFGGALGDLVFGLAAKDDLDRAFRAHHRDLGSRPGVVQVAA